MKMKRTTGKFIVTTTLEEKVRAFVPRPLPPIPQINLDQKLKDLLIQAENDLRHLNIAARLLPDMNWFIYAFVRKEAVLSSQIEGTQATLEDVLDYEVNSKNDSSDDVQEVCNYITALNYAVKEIRSKKGLPLSLRMLREAHQRLLKGGRGKHKSPGEFRESQNWIGGTRPGNAQFVPPPPDQLKSCLSDLEKYMHSTNDLPDLIRIGLCHVQFETVHPFLDGNGRIGRLLILLMMLQYDLLEEPILYLSLYFKKHRKEYYRLLQEVRTTGAWEAWLAYYLEGISAIAKETTDSSQSLFTLLQKDRTKLVNSKAATVLSIRLMELLPSNPIVTLPKSVKLLKTTKPTALKSIRILEDTGILSETTGSKKNKKYAYTKYIDILKADTEI
ncbi:Fic family protein [Oligoflexia bacterium]|nr:Fic family protein [Oligoflexia bacterium]